MAGIRRVSLAGARGWNARSARATRGGAPRIAATALSALVLGASALGAPCRALAADAAPAVPAFARFFSAPESDLAAGGALLWNELACAACHAETPRATTGDGASADGLAAPAAKTAPILDRVASRVKAEYLRKFLADPQGTKPGATMPNLLHGLEGAARAEQVEALVHYLNSLGGGAPTETFPLIGASARGEKLFFEVGCAACHDSPKEGAAALPTSKPLGDLTAKYTLASLSGFLMDPLAVRPSGRMPHLRLSGAEARDLAAFLIKGLPEVANVKYSYYEGSFPKLPDFSTLTAKTVGGTSVIDVSHRERDDNFALRFEGFLRVDAEGEYRFFTTSDDGSRLWINGQLVVDNDGVHAPQEKSGKIKLAPGLHAIEIAVFEVGGGEELKAEYEGPGVPRGPVALAMTAVKDLPEKHSFAFEAKPELAAQGRKLFAEIGCASCHSLTENGARVASKLAAPAARGLAAAKGCLSDAPGKAPRYALSPRQGEALRAALAATQQPTPAAPTPAETLRSTLLTFNCYACHARGAEGGVEPERDAFFQTNMPEMGDEGRLPPSLNGVGAKLTLKYLSRLLAEGADDRPYMHTRMPSFGAANVGHLAPLLEKLDAAPALPEVKFDEPITAVRHAGWTLVGAKGFSCTKCHTFGPYKAEGVQSIDLTVMSERLREDWFRRYVRNPQAFRRGTRMPQAWPADESLIPDVLGGSSERQIAAVWNYLSQGKMARTPTGLVVASMMLEPFNEAIIYRNFIQGGGPRAIGVGYPEGRHLVFDANELRLALLWQGAFIDAKRHWTDRGVGFEPPAGQGVLALPGEVSFATLADVAAAWPKTSAKTLGYRFLGYRTAPDQRPTFLYQVGAARVEDFCNPTANGQGVRRELTLTAEGSVDNLYFRAAAGAIEPAADGWHAVGGLYRVRVTGGEPIVRKEGGGDLLVPVKFKDGKAVLTQEFQW